ncbi:MAG: efflux RND transporter permease subunit, partial [Spirochaetota bacterium]
MAKYIDLVLKKPVLFIAVLLIMTVILGTGLGKLRFDSSVDAMMPKRDSEYLENQKLKEIYGNNGKFMIMGVSPGNLWNSETLEEINQLINDIDEYSQFNKEKEDKRLKSFRALTSRKSISLHELRKIYNDDRPYLRLILRKMNTLGIDDVHLTQSNLEDIFDELQKSYRLRKKEFVDTIISPLTMKDIVGEDDTLRAINLIPLDENGVRQIPKTREEIETFKENLTRNPAFDRGLYYRDNETGEITDFCLLVRFINVRDQDDITEELWNLTKSYHTLNITVQGIPIINHQINEYMQHDLETHLPLVLLVVVMIFFFNFRSFRGVVLPFVTLVMADLWVMGLMGHLGVPMTVMGISIPPLMIAVGSSYSIHILNQYYIDFDDISSQGKKRGLLLSMSHISVTVMLAGVTTFFGFMTLATNQVSAIQEWGIFSAVGVLFTILISTTIIPAMLVLMPHTMPKLLLKKDKRVKKTLVDMIVQFVTWLSLKHSMKVIIVVVLLMIVSIAGMTRINVETSIIGYFKEKDYIISSLKEIGRKFGGAYGLNILINSEEMDGVKDPEYLKTLESLRTWLEAEENSHLNVGRTECFTDFIKRMHMAMNNGNQDYYAIPDTKETIWDYLEIYSGEDTNFDGRYDEFEPYVDTYFQTANIFARTWEKEGYRLGSNEFKIIQKDIKDHLEKTLPDKYTYEVTGEPAVMVRMSHYIVVGQIMSLVLCVIVVSLIIFLLFKNWKAGVVALIPMSTAVIINFGIMGWFGVSLDLATAIIASMVIGIGVDDTVHFLNSYRHLRNKDYSVDDTIAGTLAVSGKAIIFTSMALIFGFSVL